MPTTSITASPLSQGVPCPLTPQRSTTTNHDAVLGVLRSVALAALQPRAVTSGRSDWMLGNAMIRPHALQFPNPRIQVHEFMC